MRTGANSTDSVEGQEARLEKDEYLRYGRQLIVPEIGILGTKFCFQAPTRSS
jgi:hypothetical protein